MSTFKFRDYDKLTDGEIEIIIKEKQPAPRGEGYVPQYYFNIHLSGKSEPIGRIRLRVGNTRRVIMYAGHVGFEINEKYRGHRYAANACNLIKTVALDHGINNCWITCRPDNLPSRKICGTTGARFIEVVDIPEDYDMYERGNRQMCRYKWDLLE